MTYSASELGLVWRARSKPAAEVTIRSPGLIPSLTKYPSAIGWVISGGEREEAPGGPPHQDPLAFSQVRVLKHREETSPRYAGVERSIPDLSRRPSLADSCRI